MKIKVWIIIAVAFVAIMILAAVLYPKLSEKYSSGGDSEPSNETSENLVEAYDFTVYDSEMNAVKLSEYLPRLVIKASKAQSLVSATCFIASVPRFLPSGIVRTR